MIVGGFLVPSKDSHSESSFSLSVYISSSVLFLDSLGLVLALSITFLSFESLFFYVAVTSFNETKNLQKHNNMNTHFKS